MKKAYAEKRRKPIQYWLGKKRPEMAAWVRKSHLGWKNLNVAGEKNWNWKGGISKDKYYNNVIYLKKYRHEKSINKRYNSLLGISYTKEYKKNQNQKYRSLKRNGGELTIQTIQQVYEDNIKKNGTLTCYLCLKPIEFGKDNLEHKIPLSRGGTNICENLDIACRYCNGSKHNRTEEEYRKHQEVKNICKET